MAEYFGTDAGEVITGSSGDDVIHSSKGQDILDGGDGYDLAIIDYSNAGSAGETYNHNLSYMYDSLYGSFRGAGAYIGTETVRIESIDFRGSAATDIFYADLSRAPGTWRVSLDAGGGFDVISLTLGGDALVGSVTNGVLDAGRIVLKNFEQFSLTLGSHDDNVILGAGYDTVKAGDGNDTIDGGAGDDVLEGQRGGDHLSGGDGNDRLFADDSYLSIDQGTEIDVLSGGAGNDVISMGYGDSADGGSGTDTLSIGLTGGSAGDKHDLSAVFASSSITINNDT